MLLLEQGVPKVKNEERRGKEENRREENWNRREAEERERIKGGVVPGTGKHLTRSDFISKQSPFSLRRQTTLHLPSPTPFSRSLPLPTVRRFVSFNLWFLVLPMVRPRDPRILRP